MTMDPTRISAVGVGQGCRGKEAPTMVTLVQPGACFQDAVAWFQ